MTTPIFTIGTVAVLPGGVRVVPVTCDRHNITFDVEVIEKKHLGGAQNLSLVQLRDGAAHFEASWTTTEYGTTWHLAPTYVGSVLAETLTQGEYEELAERLSDHYRRDTTTTTHVVKLDVADSPTVSLDVDAIEKTPSNWEPGVVGRLMGPGLSQGYPGGLTGWRERAAAIAKEYCNDVWTHNGTQHIEALVKSWYDPPKVTRTKAQRRQPARDVQTFKTTTVKIETPTFIAGHSLPDARAIWAAREQDVRDQILAVAGSKVCGHCNGSGWIITKRLDLS